LLFICFRLIHFRVLYTFPQSIGIASGRPSPSYYFVGSQADNLFYLDPHHARIAIPLRLLLQVVERERGIPIRQTTPERGSVSPPGPIARQNIACVESHRLDYIFASPSGFAVSPIEVIIDQQLIIRWRTKAAVCVTT
jgi:Peptidase family C54